ncbi:DUF1993 family protein [Nostoc commune]|uniref:DUF1993 family protein n=1 Tax=Nostoc commune TaxID=1178 RepID=UPI0039BFA7DB
MYQASIPVSIRALNNLINILEKGAAYAETKKIDPSVLINSRLSPDTALTAAMRYILKAESYDRRGARGKLYCIIAGSAVCFHYLNKYKLPLI